MNRLDVIEKYKTYIINKLDTGEISYESLLDLED